MKQNLKSIIVSLSFILIITGFMICNGLSRDKEVSWSERRKLAEIPEFSFEKLINREFMTKFENYSLDQFVFRDEFRSLKAFARLYMFNQKDNNELYYVNNSIYKLEYPLNEDSIKYAIKKINDIENKYLKDMNVYYSVIPDKNYFIAAKQGYLAIDYDKLNRLLYENVKNMTYINLYDQLSIDDYYRTDLHWRQENIVDVADFIMKEMGSHVNRLDYFRKTMGPFYGSYYGQGALAVEPDTITYLFNEVIEQSLVYDYEKKENISVYQPSLFSDMDSYNLFLGGPRALLTIENPYAPQDKELILFRDSFGSSIAPLFIEGYSKITMVDLRYISSNILDRYIDFNPNQDVYFLYSIPILNNSFMLK